MTVKSVVRARTTKAQKAGAAKAPKKQHKPRLVHRRKKAKYTLKDHLTAYLVLIAVIVLIMLGALALFLSGIFDPVEVESTLLTSTVPLNLATPSPEEREAARQAEEAAKLAEEQAAREAEAAALEAEGEPVGLLQWLFPSAKAEEAPEAEAAAASDNAPIIVNSSEELEALLADIVAEDQDDAEIPESDRISVDKADLAINENLPDNVYNVLLMATDSRDVNSHSGRSDVMIIASLNTLTNEIKLTSLSRDMYVAIPGATSNKLNAAHAYGGPNLAMKTVNTVFEMNIQDYAVVNFATMASIVDALGGVDIYLAPMEYYYINYNVAVSEDYEGFEKSSSRRTLTDKDQETVVHLDGLQGVAYARIRKLDSDIQRGSRQRILLQAMMDKAMESLSPATFYGLATSILNSTSTNINLNKVIEIGTWILSADSVTMDEQSIPVPGSFRGTKEKDMDVITFALPQNVTALHEFLYGEYIPAVAAQ